MATLVNINDPKEREQELARRRAQATSSVPTRRQETGRAPITQETHKALIAYYTNMLSTYITTFNIRPQMLQRDLAYYRENDYTRTQQLAANANAAGDASKIQNVTIPVVMPQVESALAYHTSVFLTGYPIFASVAGPKYLAEMKQMDTIIGENSIRFGWVKELMKTIRNGLKYDLGACEVTWEKKKAAKIGTPQIKQLTTGTVDEIEYQGNRIKDLDPYNIILDTRVSPDENHIKGEFAGYTEIVSAVDMKQRLDELDPLSSMNFKEAFKSPSTGAGVNDQTAGYFIPAVNPNALLPASQQQPFSWDLFFNNMPSNDSGRIKYQSSYEWSVLYVRLIPRTFGISVRNPNHVQIWKFIIINRAVIVFAEQQTAAHCMLPIIVCKPSNDGMKWQSKSFAQNAEPYQAIASALINSGLESQRRKVYDRIFYDANRVQKTDIDRVSSVARIPVKNSQYNKDIASAVHVVPYRDDGVDNILAFSQNIVQMAEVGNGQNRVSQGQFQKGNKTRREFETVMTNANSRPQMQALAMEYSFFTPIKEIIKSNTLQYQQPTLLQNSLTKEEVQVDPAALRNAVMAFKVSDGLLPAEKMIGGDLFPTFLQMAQAIPEMRVEYDIMGAVGYQMQLAGAQWLPDFKRTPEQQQAYMQMMAQSAVAAGNAKPPEAPTSTTPEE